jgi:uncharacterized membrane protein YdfJ with MMPL/SSD domain
VDYSAHIMHRFLTEVATAREERVIATLTNIGPAVLNGGFSTFLAFILLATSQSHVFSSFFKIFFLVVTFGLYHGLVFLPVVLSLIGPLPAVRHSYAAVEMYAVGSGDEPTVTTSPSNQSENGRKREDNSIKLEPVQSNEST